MLVSYDLSKIKMLVAEKQAPMRTMFRQVLREFGVEIVFDSSNPEDAFELFNHNKPDLVLTDWAPDFDGLGLLRKIRTDPDSEYMQAPVIMVTAYNETSHIYKDLDAGMTEYLSKPLSAKLLYLRIVSVIQNKRCFIRVNEFIGPDRRLNFREFSGRNRRIEGNLAAAFG